MLRRKKKPESLYKNESLGALTVHKVQMPHSLTEADGSYFEVLTWTFSIQVGERGRCLMQRSYIKGNDEAVGAMRTILRDHARIESLWQAEDMFYSAVTEAWRMF